jgi:hypothetical protein
MNIFYRSCCLAVLAVLAATLAGCATMSYTLVPAGSQQVGNLEFNVSGAWNSVPVMMTPFSREDARVWTRNGVLLDRFFVIPAVKDGQAIFRQAKQSQALPLFHAGMLPNELMELMESSVVKLFGEGNAVVSTDNLRPYRFGDTPGVLFDFAATVAEGPNYKGVVGMINVDGELYVLMYMGADPYYFDRSLSDATAQIQSARVLS